MQIVKLCIQVLVSVSKKSESMTTTEAEKCKQTSTSIRVMATKLDTQLIKVYRKECTFMVSLCVCIRSWMKQLLSFKD